MRTIVTMVACLGLAGCGLWDKLTGKGDDQPMGDDVFVDAAIVEPDAAPPEFAIGGRVANVLGTGLVLTLDGGETLRFDADAPFAFTDTRREGETFDVTISTEPTGPAQACVIRNGAGTVSSQDVTSIEVECAVGTLRINEISSCFFANVPCWIEVLNTSATASEDLASYHLRSTAALRTGGTAPVNHDFTLPALTIPPGGYAIVRGRATDDLVDGLNVVNLVDAGLVPFWGASGFVELTKTGKTVDFVRLGGNTIAPTTIGWNGPGTVDAPSSMTYGPALARDAASDDTNAAGDWALHAFGTPGGVNDITDDTDADADGIPDQAETSGGHFAGLDLFAMGARTAQKDIFLEIDYMTSANPGVTPRQAALDKVVAAFAPHGIVIHPDVGSLIGLYNLGGGNAIADSALISLGAFGGAVNHYALKAANMDVRRQAYAHYVVFGEQLTNVPAGTAGLAEVDGNNLVVALGFLNLTTDTTANTNRLNNYQATTIMHELGHNLGLLHGGNEDANYKANYVSAMNYLYSFSGSPTIGNDEGDRYRLFRAGAGCATAGEPGLTNPPQSTTFIMDFSSGTSAALDETALVETQGLRRPGSTGVDFNCSGAITGTVAVDLVAGINTLNDYNDWANLHLGFIHATSGQGLVHRISQDHFTDELRPLADETGFHP